MSTARNLALQALRSVLDRPDTAESYDAMMATVQDAIAALEAETGEPVACYADHRLTPEGTTEFYGYADKKLEPGTMLYTAPPTAAPREPVAWRKNHKGVIDVAHSYTDDPGDVSAWAKLGVTLEPLYAAPIPVVPQWLPIELAPKDGTAILLGSRCGAWIGKWKPIYTSGYQPENPWSSLMLNHDHMAEKWQTPTHFMPLPAAPGAPACE